MNPLSICKSQSWDFSGYDFRSPYEDESIERHRNWCFVIYPEWGNLKEILCRITSAPCIFAFSPLHQDIDGEGKPLKLHYHCVVLFSNARSRRSVARLFSLPENLLFACVNVDAYIRYLTHYGWDKRQYSKDDIFTNNEALVARAYKNDGKLDSLIQGQLIKNALENLHFKTEFDFVMWCEENNLQDFYKKYHWAISNTYFRKKEIKKE